MSDIRGRNQEGTWKDIRLSNNADLLLVTGKLVKSKTTKALAAATDYAAEDVLAASDATAWKFTDVVMNKGGSGVIVYANALCSTTNLTPRLTLYLFEVNPTSTLTDNAANTSLLAADLQYYIGRIDFPSMDDLGGYSGSIVTPSTYGNIPIPFVLLSGTDMYGVLVTRDAITSEAAGMTVTIILGIIQY